VAGEDYQGAQGELVFNGGQTEQTVAVPVFADARDEPDETFALELTTRDAPVADGLAVATVRDRPVVTAAEFVYQSGSPQRVRFTFSQDVRASVSAADLSVERVGGGPVEVSPPAYDAATNTATFAFSAGTLPNGNYRATLLAAGVTNAAGTSIAANHVLDFFVLTGDVNRDRFVNGTDFALLAANFGRSGPGITYGRGDLNGDGSVNGTDFALLAGNFGKSMPAPAAAAAAAPAASLRTPGPAARPADARPRRRVTRNPPRRSATPVATAALLDVRLTHQ
jgi:hypothetical protein